MGKKDWPSKKIWYNFKDSDLHVQVIQNLFQEGYRAWPSYGGRIVLTKKGISGHIFANKFEIEFLSDCFSLTADMEKKTLQIVDDSAHAMRIIPDAIISPTVKATFIPDGNLNQLDLFFILHHEIDRELLFRCKIDTGRDHGHRPEISLSVSEYVTDEGYPRSCVQVEYRGNSFWGDANPFFTTITKTSYFDGKKIGYHHDGIMISEETLEKWREQLLLEYQTSDAKILEMVFIFFKKLSSYIEKGSKNYLTYNSFQWLDEVCKDYLGKYVDEVSESVSYDLGLSNAKAIKHILRYVQKR